MVQNKKNKITDKIIKQITIQIIIWFFQFIILPLLWLLWLIVLIIFLSGSFLSILGSLFWWNKVDSNKGYTNNIITLDAQVNSVFYEDLLGLPPDTKIKDKAYIINNDKGTYIVTRKSLNLALFWYFNSPILTKQQIQDNIEFNPSKLYNNKKITWDCTKLVDTDIDYKEELCSNKWIINWMGHYPLLQLFNPLMINPEGYNIKNNMAIKTLPSFFDIYQKKKTSFNFWWILDFALKSKKVWYIKNWLRIKTNNWYGIDGYITGWKTFKSIYWNYHNIEYLWPLVNYNTINPDNSIPIETNKMSPQSASNNKKAKSMCEKDNPKKNCVKENNNNLMMSKSIKGRKNHDWYDLSSNSSLLYNPFLGGGYYLWTYFNWLNSQSYLLSNIWARLKVYYISWEKLRDDKGFKDFKTGFINSILIPVVKANPSFFSNSLIIKYIKGDFLSHALASTSKIYKNTIISKLQHFISYLYIYIKVNNLNPTTVLTRMKGNLTDPKLKSKLIELMMISNNQISLTSLRKKAKEVYNKIYNHHWKFVDNNWKSILSEADKTILQEYFIWELFENSWSNIDITVLNMLENSSNNKWLQEHKKIFYYHLVLKALHTKGNFLLDKRIYNNLKLQFISKIDSYIDFNWIEKYLLPLLKQKNNLQSIRLNDWIKKMDILLSDFLWEKIEIEKLQNKKELNKKLQSITFDKKKELIKKILLLFYKSKIRLSDNNKLDSIVNNYKFNLSDKAIIPNSWDKSPSIWVWSVLEVSNPNIDNIKIAKITNENYVNIEKEFRTKLDTIIKKKDKVNKILPILINIYITKYNEVNKNIININKIYNAIRNIIPQIQTKIQNVKQKKNGLISFDNDILSDQNIPSESGIRETLLYWKNNHINNIFPFINYGDLFAIRWNIWMSEWEHAHIELIPFITKHKFIQKDELNELQDKLLWKELSIADEIWKESKIKINRLLKTSSCINLQNNENINCDSVQTIINQVNKIQENNIIQKKILSWISFIAKNNNISILNYVNNIAEKWWKKYKYYLNNSNKVTNILQQKMTILLKNIDKIWNIYITAGKIFDNTFIAPGKEKNNQNSNKDYFYSIISSKSHTDNNISNYAIITKGKTSSKINNNINNYTINRIPCNISNKSDLYSIACQNNFYKTDNLNSIIGYNFFQQLSSKDNFFGLGLSPYLFNSFLKLFAISYYNKLSRYINLDPLPLFNLEYAIRNEKTLYSPIYKNEKNSKYMITDWIVWYSYKNIILNNLNIQTGLWTNFLKKILNYKNVGKNDKLFLLGTTKYCSQIKPTECYVPVSARTNSLYNDMEIYWWTNFLTYPTMTQLPYNPGGVYYSLWIYQFLYYYLWSIKIRDWNLLNDLNNYWKAVLIKPMTYLNYSDLFNLSNGINDFNIWNLSINKVFNLLKDKLSKQKDMTLWQKKKIFKQTIIKRYYYNLYFLTRLNSMNTYFKHIWNYKFSISWFILPYNWVISRSEIYLKLLNWVSWLLGWIYDYFIQKMKSTKELLIECLDNNSELISQFKKVWISSEDIKNINKKPFNYLLKFINNNKDKSIFPNTDNLWPIQLYDLWFYSNNISQQKEILGKIQNAFDSNSLFSSLGIYSNSEGSYLYSPVLSNLLYKIYNDTYLNIHLVKDKNNNLVITKIIKITLNLKDNDIKQVKVYNSSSDIKKILNIYSSDPMINVLNILTTKNSWKNIMSASLLLFNYLLNIKNNLEEIKEIFNHTNYLVIHVLNPSITVIDFSSIKNVVDSFNKQLDKLRYSLGNYGEVLYLKSNDIDQQRYKIDNNFILSHTAISKILKNGGLWLPDIDTSTVNWLEKAFRRVKYDFDTLYNPQAWTNFDFTTDKLDMALWHFIHESGGRNDWYGGSWMWCYMGPTTRNISPLNWFKIFKKTYNDIKWHKYSQNYITMGAKLLTKKQCTIELKKIRQGVGDKTIYIYSSYSFGTKTYGSAIDNYVIKPNKDIILYSFNAWRPDKWDIILKEMYNYLHNWNHHSYMKWFDMSWFPVNRNMNWLWFVGIWQMSPRAMYVQNSNWIYIYLTKQKWLSSEKANEIIKKSSSFTQLILLEYLWNYNNNWYKNYWLNPPKTLLDKSIKNLWSYNSVIRQWLRRYNHSNKYINAVINNYNYYKGETSNGSNSISYSRDYKVKILSYIYLYLINLKIEKHPDLNIDQIEKQVSDSIINKQLIIQLIKLINSSN